MSLKVEEYNKDMNTYKMGEHEERNGTEHYTYHYYIVRSED